jgi:RNA polymerase sigma-70 factor (ECF subfamily)
MQDVDPDKELVERAQRELPYGTAAYNEIVRRHSAQIYRRAYRILRSEPDAEEAVQDVFLAVFRNLPRYRADRPFSHWLSAITLNACRMLLRKRSAEQRRRDALEAEPDPPPAGGPDDPALRHTVHALLDQLEPGTRIPMLMRFVEGHSYKEIAQELELSESAVKMRVSRGSARLRALYEEMQTRARTARGEGPTDG